MTDALQALLDKQAITELLLRYCRAVDRLDVPLGHAIWHPDGYADYGASYYQGPGRGVIDRICQDHLGLVSHQHRLTNVLIEPGGADAPDAAGSEAYVSASLRMEREGKTMQIRTWGRYCDRWERRKGAWGLLHRVVVFDHQDICEVTPLPGHGLPPARDRTDPSYPVLTGGKP